MDGIDSIREYALAIGTHVHPRVGDCWPHDPERGASAPRVIEARDAHGEELVPLVVKEDRDDAVRVRVQDERIRVIRSASHEHSNHEKTSLEPVEALNYGT